MIGVDLCVLVILLLCSFVSGQLKTNQKVHSTRNNSKIKTTTKRTTNKELYKLSSLGQTKNLIWNSNDAGLFSHFFQTKYMNQVAKSLNRTLIIVPYHDTVHAKNISHVNLCDIFDFSKEQITCPQNRSDIMPLLKMRCSKLFSSLEHQTTMKNVCFNGKIFGTSGIVSLEDRLAINNVTPRLKFNQSNVVIFNQIKDSFLYGSTGVTAANSITNSNNFGTIAAVNSITNSKSGLKGIKSTPLFLVVHWRRGDQLTTRCTPKWKGVRDYSINCQSVVALVNDIQSVSTE